MAIDPNIKEMIAILTDLRLYLEDSESSSWASSDPPELIKEIELVIEQLNKANISGLKLLKLNLAPTGCYQEIAIDNGWGDDLLSVASNFNSVYHRIIHAKPMKSLET